MVPRAGRLQAPSPPSPSCSAWPPSAVALRWGRGMGTEADADRREDAIPPAAPVPIPLGSSHPEVQRTSGKGRAVGLLGLPVPTLSAHRLHLLAGGRCHLLPSGVIAYILPGLPGLRGWGGGVPCPGVGSGVSHLASCGPPLQIFRDIRGQINPQENYPSTTKIQNYIL